MNGYLVIATSAFRDVPLRLFASRDDALAFAGTVRPRDNPAMDRQFSGKEGDELPTLSLFDRFHFVSLVPFVDGVPGEPEPVAHLTHEVTLREPPAPAVSPAEQDPAVVNAGHAVPRRKRKRTKDLDPHDKEGART